MREEGVWEWDRGMGDGGGDGEEVKGGGKERVLGERGSGEGRRKGEGESEREEEIILGQVSSRLYVSLTVNCLVLVTVLFTGDLINENSAFLQ